MGRPTKPDPTNGDLSIEVLALKKAAHIIRAINHPLRQKLLKSIHQRKHVSVSELYKDLRLEQSVTSMHLADLRKAGCVTVERIGRNMYYSVNYQRIKAINEFVKDLLQAGCLVLPMVA